MRASEVRNILAEIRHDPAQPAPPSRLLTLRDAAAYCMDQGLKSLNLRWWRDAVNERIFPSTKTGQRYVREDYVVGLVQRLAARAA